MTTERKAAIRKTCNAAMRNTLGCSWPACGCAVFPFAFAGGESFAHDHILAALTAAGTGTYDTRTHAAVPRELTDQMRRAALARRHHIRGIPLWVRFADAQGEGYLDARDIDAAWHDMLAAAEAEAKGGDDA